MPPNIIVAENMRRCVTALGISTTPLTTAITGTNNRKWLTENTVSPFYSVSTIETNRVKSVRLVFCCE
jgi:hypothetical protein